VLGCVTKGMSVGSSCGVHNEKMERSGWLSFCVLRNGTLGRGMCITRYEYSIGGVSVAVAGFGSDCKTIEERHEISMGFIVNYGFFYGLWGDDMASRRKGFRRENRKNSNNGLYGNLWGKRWGADMNRTLQRAP
jgi:hypothetical protein